MADRTARRQTPDIVPTAILRRPRGSRFFIPAAASIPYASIDEEHQQLVEHLNLLNETGATCGFRAITIVPLFEAFRSLVATHFSHEEQAMARTGFHALDRHREHHCEFLANVTAVCEQMRRGCFAAEADVKALFTSIIDDALRDDLVFKAFLEGRGLIPAPAPY